MNIISWSQLVLEHLHSAVILLTVVARRMLDKNDDTIISMHCISLFLCRVVI
jgi:hypothetical protein